MSVVVYTCYFGRHEPFNPTSMGSGRGADRVVFTDDVNLTVPPDIRVIYVDSYGLPSNRISRRYKLMPHLVFQDYDWSIYVDNRVNLKMSPDRIVADMADKSPDAILGLFAHHQRNCIYQEARSIRRSKPVTLKRLDAQIGEYRAQYMPAESGLYAGTFLVRPRADDRAMMFALRWYEEFMLHSERDQLGLAFLIWSMKIRPHLFKGSLVENDFMDWPAISNRQRQNYQNQRSQ